MTTRADVEAVTTKRLGALLAEAQMEATGSPNPHLVDPIGWALRALGYSPAGLTDITDADLVPLAAAHMDALLDLAELRALESVLGNLTAVDVTMGPVSERKGMLGDRLAKLVDQKRKTVQARWGGVLAQPLEETGGTVRIISL